MKTQPSVVVLGYFHLHPQNKVFFNEYNGRQKTLCCFHSEGKKDQYDWAEYSQAIASAMSKRMSELGLTQQMLAGKINCAFPKC